MRAVTGRSAARKVCADGLADEWREGHQPVAAPFVWKAQRIGGAAEVPLGAEVVEVDGENRTGAQREAPSCR
ncbi:hypothetical protein ACFW9L_38100 [Streptomyces sp. NPDC059517]|uniref:hypothetical protein n=1 Tax=Streptomyces sp. NPDC059517 TaxID=3346855 RepID=UPI0036D0075F